VAEDKKPIEANELRLTTITGCVTAILAPIGAVVATFIETRTYAKTGSATLKT